MAIYAPNTGATTRASSNVTPLQGRKGTLGYVPSVPTFELTKGGR